MSPSQPQTSGDQAKLSPQPPTPQSVQTTQPVALQAMDPQRPQQEQPEFGHLRGGDRGGLCPGRFCFCVPCPLPCDCCII